MYDFTLFCAVSIVKYWLNGDAYSSVGQVFSSTVTGYFSLAHKSISFPMSMISKSFGQVLFQRVSDLKSQGRFFN